MEDTLPASSASTPPTGGDRYRLIERIDEGAMGVVWLAEDTALHRKVAVKLLHDRFLAATLQEQLAREARTMARLSHPNVVAVYDVGELGGRMFLAMELVDGEPLSRWLTTPRPWPEVLEVFRGVAAGLTAAHAVGVVHRDIKPGNILIGRDGRPRIADFGIAHAATLGGDVTATTRSTAGMIGSPAYMPPERLRGDPAGKKGDQFGFFAAFYEALHGQRPFAASTLSELADAIERGPPPPRRDVPAWLHAVVARGLAADPDERHASMADVAVALRPPPTRTRSWLLLALGLLGGSAIATVVVLLVVGRAPRPVAAPAPDARAVAIEPARLAPDATPPPDASVPPLDAAPPPPPPPAKVRKPVQAADPLAGLTDEQIKAKYDEMYAAQKAAADRKDYRTASRIAEQMVPFAVARHAGPAGWRKMSVTYACLDHDASRARKMFARMPDIQNPPDWHQARQIAVEICSREGIDLPQ